jgi:hypothetical protein
MDQDFDSRVLVGGQSFRCRLLVSDFSHPPLRRPELVWEMSGDGFKPRRGNLRFRHRPFVTYPAGSVRIVLPNVGRPVAVTLQATLREGDRSLGNQWRFWVFPGRVGMPSGTGIYGRPKHTWIRKVRGASACPRGRPDAGHVKVLLTERIDEALVNYIRSGGRAVLAASEGLVRPFGPKLGLNVGRYFFLPPANYGPFEDGHSGTIVRRHPMLGAIPHEGFADLQLYRLIAESPPLDLKPFEPCGGEPVIRAISTYFVSHPLAYLAEFRLGKGILVISALDLNPEWPEARYLLAEVLGYVSQTGARPRAQLTDQAVQHLLDVGALP